MSAHDTTFSRNMFSLKAEQIDDSMDRLHQEDSLFGVNTVLCAIYVIFRKNAGGFLEVTKGMVKIRTCNL